MPRKKYFVWQCCKCIEPSVGQYNCICTIHIASKKPGKGSGECWQMERRDGKPQTGGSYSDVFDDVTGDPNANPPVRGAYKQGTGWDGTERGKPTWYGICDCPGSSTTTRRR